MSSLAFAPSGGTHPKRKKRVRPSPLVKCATNAARKRAWKRPTPVVEPVSSSGSESLGPVPLEIEEDTLIVEGGTDDSMDTDTAPVPEPGLESTLESEPEPQVEPTPLPNDEELAPETSTLECDLPTGEVADAPELDMAVEQDEAVEPFDMVTEESDPQPGPEPEPTVSSPPETTAQITADSTLVSSDDVLPLEPGTSTNAGRVFVHNVVTALDQRFRGVVTAKVNAVEEQVAKLMDYFEPVVRSQPGRPTNSANMRTAMLERTMQELGGLVDQLQVSIDQTKAVSAEHKDKICEIVMKVIKRMKEMEATFAVFMIPADNAADPEATSRARDAVKLLAHLESRVAELEALGSARSTKNSTLEDRFALMDQRLGQYEERIATLERSNAMLRSELDVVRTIAHQRPISYIGGQVSNSSSPVNIDGRITPVSRSSPTWSSPAQSPPTSTQTTSPAANVALAASGFLDSLQENGLSGDSFLESMGLFENNGYMFSTLVEPAEAETSA